jgi:predicted TIM-barrel fold metal-dependent hydrolase
MIAVALHKGNVSWELSGWAPQYFSDALKRDIRSRLKDKVMFGSDYPSIPYDRLFKEWRELKYSDELMQNIFHSNAERILGL